jgi:hypothetical protein
MHPSSNPPSTYHGVSSRPCACTSPSCLPAPGSATPTQRRSLHPRVAFLRSLTLQPRCKPCQLMQVACSPPSTHPSTRLFAHCAARASAPTSAAPTQQHRTRATEVTSTRERSSIKLMWGPLPLPSCLEMLHNAPKWNAIAAIDGGNWWVQPRPWNACEYAENLLRPQKRPSDLRPRGATGDLPPCPATTPSLWTPLLLGPLCTVPFTCCGRATPVRGSASCSSGLQEHTRY